MASNSASVNEAPITALRASNYEFSSNGSNSAEVRGLEPELYGDLDGLSSLNDLIWEEQEYGFRVLHVPRALQRTWAVLPESQINPLAPLFRLSFVRQDGQHSTDTLFSASLRGVSRRDDRLLLFGVVSFFAGDDVLRKIAVERNREIAKAVLKESTSVARGAGGICGTTYYEIDLSNQGLTGSLPASLTGIPTLQKLLLENNSFSGELPDGWSGFAQIVEIKIRNNSLTGTLPDSWSALSTLEKLNLRLNSLSGTLPASWASMTAMENMKLSYNSLDGELPSEWSAWTYLQRLCLDNNLLSGPLPDSWSAFISIKKLNLSNNMLTSFIPSSWALMAGAQDGLYFDNNPDLTCNAPPEWSETEFSCEGTFASSPPQIAPEPLEAPLVQPEDAGLEEEFPETPSLPPTESAFAEPVSPPVASPEAALTPATPPVAVPEEEWRIPVAPPEQAVTADIEPAPEPAPEPEVSAIADATEDSFCSASALRCERTENGVYEEIQVGTAYTLSTLFQGNAVYGLKSLDTSVPTPPNRPHLIQIISEQIPCTKPATAELQIAILCPENQFYCERDNATFCSLTELCINLEGASEILDNTLGSPMLQLNGEERVQITVGESYSLCQPCQSSLFDGVCDPGATAWDPVEGNLTLWVEACSTATAVHYLDRDGLTGCAINSSTPGVHNLTFSVRDSLGEKVSDVRQLVVVPECPDGEFVCKDVLECSVGQSCFLHTGKVEESIEVDLDALTAPTVEPNNSMALVLTEAVGQRVTLSVGASYEKCQGGEVPAEDAKCEPGVKLEIFPGQQTIYDVFACPSGPCRHAGVEFCSGSLFSENGLGTCNFDFSAPPGTQYEISFMAVPSNSSLPRLYARRFLILESGCEDGAYFCDGACSPVPCDRYAAITYDAQPTLQSRFPEGLSIAYGVSAELTILPCSDPTLCGVQATDLEDGDISSSVVVTETTPCEGERTSCRFCDPEFLPSGDCLPGYYRYTYAVEDSAGQSAESLTVEVNIIELSEFVVTVSHLSTQDALTDAYLEDQSGSVTQLSQDLAEALAAGFESRGMDAELPAESFKTRSVDGLLQLQTCFVGLENQLTSVNATTAAALLEPAIAFHAPLLFNSTAADETRSNRRLLQTSDDDSFQDSIASAGELLTLVDVSYLDLSLNGTQTTLLTEDVDYILGSILSVLGEMDVLYQESVSQVAALIQAIQASMPDTTTQEKQLMADIEALFLEQRRYYEYVENRLNNTESFDLTGQLEEMLNATRSAAKQTMAMINEQLEAMGELRSYRGFVEAVGRMENDYTCIDHTPERRYRFTVPTESSDGASRRLLQARASSARSSSATTGSASSPERANIWGAYELKLPDLSAHGPNAEAMPMETMLRGATNDRNYIVGGVVIQTDRFAKSHICYGRFAHLIEYCYAIPLHEIDPSTTPYGRDPVFLTDSVLYDEDAVNREQNYYDPADPRERSASGIPYGFQPSEIEGKLGTHFVYIDTQFGRVTAAKLLQYLSEGQFLDAMTESLVLRFVTYNPQYPATVLAVNEMRCVWKHEIECQHRIDALPDVHWSDAAALSTVILITLILVLYWSVIARRMILTRRTGLGSSVRELLWENAGDIAVATTMTVALCASSALVGFEVASLGPRLRFDVYDTSVFNGAHWLLHKRQHTSGFSDRWAMPPDVRDIQRLADFLESMGAYRRLASVNSVFQTFAITAVILRLLVVASVLPRVSLITSTLKRSVAPLMYFMLPFMAVLLLFASLGTICFGQRVAALSSFSQSLETILEFVFFGGSSLTTELTPEGVVLHPVEAAVAMAFKLSLTCLSIFIFINFVLAILTDNFLDEKEQRSDVEVKDLSTIGAEIHSAIAQYYQERRKRPKHIVPSISDVRRRQRVPSVKKTPLSEPRRTPSSVGAVQEVELTTPSRVIYINEMPELLTPSESEEDEMRVASVPIRRLDEAASDSRRPGAVRGDFASRLERVEDRIHALLETYAMARQWAVHARLDLIRTEWLQPLTRHS